MKENNLIIPESYYDFMIVGYHTVSSKKSITKTKSNKICRMYDGIVYCHCLSLNDFGIVTFYFENNLKLDLDIRDYVSYNESAFYFNCKVDVILSKNDEFIVGLRGLNNTILTFNMEEKTIKFFHKLKFTKNYESYVIMIGLIFIILGIFTTPMLIGFGILLVFYSSMSNFINEWILPF